MIKTSKDWRDHTLSWLSVWKGPLYISYYEKMKSDHYAELNHLVRFMGINATVRDLWCVGDSLKYFKGENPVRLQHSVVYMYTDQLRKIVQRDLETVQRAINKGKEL